MATTTERIIYAACGLVDPEVKIGNTVSRKIDGEQREAQASKVADKVGQYAKENNAIGLRVYLKEMGYSNITMSEKNGKITDVSWS